MFFNWIARVFRVSPHPSRRQRRAARPATRPRFQRLYLERLEDRIVPTTDNWIVGSGLWDVGSNWSQGSAPGVNGASSQAVIDTTSAATVTITSSDNISIQNLQVGSNDTLSITGGGLTVTSGSSTLSGALAMSGGSLTASGSGVSLTANGTTTIADASLFAEGGATLSLPKLTSYTTANFYSTFQVSGAGSLLDLSALTTQTVNSGGRWIINAFSGGEITIGTYTPTSNGSYLNIKIGGTPASGDFGQIVVKGAATLAGTFNVYLDNNFTPSDGQDFRVMTYASVSGTFTSVNIPIQFPEPPNPEYNPTSLDLVTSNTAPIITLQPSNQAVLEGGTATFSAYAIGNPTAISVQWQYSTDGGSSWNPLSDGTLSDGTVVSGSTTDTLTLSNVAIALNGSEYRADFSNSAGSTPTNAATLTVTSAATKLAFVQQPTNTAAGASISPAVTVAVEDSSGNIDTSDNTDTVTLALGAGSPSGGVLNGTFTETVTNGVATFSDLSIDQAGTGYTLVASSSTNTSLTNATSNSFNITPAPASQLVFTQPPTNTVAGNAISPAVEVSIEDQFGNVETSDSASQVALSIATGPGGFTTGSTTTVTASSGVATFNNLVIDTAGTYTIKAASVSLSQDSTSFIVSAAGAYQLAFLTLPSNTVAGNAISPAVQVEVEDQFGNVVTTDNSDQLSMAIGSGPGGFDPSSTTTATASSGVATFSNLVIDTAGTYTLVATSGTLARVTSNEFNITPAAASQLVFTQQPTNTAPGAIISPAVTVAIEDKFGNVESSDTTDQVSVALGSTSPSGGVLNGTTTVTVTNGVATFSDLSIDQAGVGYQLVASSPTDTNLTKATSNPFNILKPQGGPAIGPTKATAPSPRATCKS